MPVSENQGQLANDNQKRGLNGRAGGRVEAAGTAPQPEYALGDISPSQTATTPDRYPGRPAIVVSSPAALTVRVTLTLDPAATDYVIYVDGAVVGAAVTSAGPHDRAADAGEVDVQVVGRDEDGTEFIESDVETVTVAAS